MRCPTCGKTAKALTKSGDEPEECPDCGEELESKNTRNLLVK